MIDDKGLGWEGILSHPNRYHLKVYEGGLKNIKNARHLSKLEKLYPVWTQKTLRQKSHKGSKKRMYIYVHDIILKWTYKLER